MNAKQRLRVSSQSTIAALLFACMNACAASTEGAESDFEETLEEASDQALCPPSTFAPYLNAVKELSTRSASLQREATASSQAKSVFSAAASMLQSTSGWVYGASISNPSPAEQGTYYFVGRIGDQGAVLEEIHRNAMQILNSRLSDAALDAERVQFRSRLEAAFAGLQAANLAPLRKITAAHFQCSTPGTRSFLLSERGAKQSIAESHMTAAARTALQNYSASAQALIADYADGQGYIELLPGSDRIEHQAIAIDRSVVSYSVLVRSEARVCKENIPVDPDWPTFDWFRGCKDAHVVQRVSVQKEGARMRAIADGLPQLAFDAASVQRQWNREWQNFER